jgi:uncharacterized protein YjiS (DUF1127 family)
MPQDDTFREPPAGYRTRVSRIRAALAAAFARSARARRDAALLLQMSDRQLADMGLTRSDLPQRGESLFRAPEEDRILDARSEAGVRMANIGAPSRIVVMPGVEVGEARTSAAKRHVRRKEAA